MLYLGHKKNVLDIFGGQRGFFNCKIVLDILEGRKRPGWGSTVGEPKSSHKSSSKSETNNRKSVTVQAETKKKQQQQAAKAAVNRKSGSKSNTNNRKNSTQQEKPASSSSKNWQTTAPKATKAVQTFWKVKSGKGDFDTTNNWSKEARMRRREEANPEQLRPRGVWPRRVEERGEEMMSVFPWKFGGQFVEVKRLQSIPKNCN